MSGFNYVNPNFPDAVKLHEQIFGASQGGNCSNCGGVGRIMMTDPNTGQMYSVTCQACAGSGQSSL